MFDTTVVGGNITEAGSAHEVYKIVEKFSQDTIIFLDVDDTLITTLSPSCRGISNNIIDDIKREKDKYPNFIEILSNWRLQRKIMLLDNNWPEIILKLKAKYRVYGLTKMDSGKFGNIESMEDWRYRELKSLKLEFTNDIVTNFQDIGMPIFYKGIFLTGNLSKAETIQQYESYLKTTKIVLVDDRLEYLEDIKKYCKKSSIDFIGILYKGLDQLKDKIDQNIAKFQKNYLIEHSEWVEDENSRKFIG